MPKLGVSPLPTNNNPVNGLQANGATVHATGSKVVLVQYLFLVTIISEWNGFISLKLKQEGLLFLKSTAQPKRKLILF